MPVIQNHSVVSHFKYPFNESEIEQWSRQQRDELGGAATFALVFCSSECVAEAQELMEIIQIYAHVPTIIGCTGTGLIAGSSEIENDLGVTVALYRFPDTQAHARHIPARCLIDNEDPARIRKHLPSDSIDINAWLLFASSESIGNESWLKVWDEATEGRVTVGGFGSSTTENPTTALFINGKIYDEGAVALGLQGDVTIEPLLSQGCRPIGSPWIVTEADYNIIHKIGNRPILEVLRDTLEDMPQDEQALAHGNVFIGLVMDEYKQSFGTGDFLVRNLAAIDPKSGAVAIATPLRVGQNLQFQIRDPHTAAVDFEQMLKAKSQDLKQREVYGACLCDCIGRGTSLYGVPDQDVKTIQDALPELPIAGLFCNGEFAPVKERTLLHGYAASLGLFVKR